MPARIYAFGASCAVDDCGRQAEKRAWCNRHYRVWLTHGDPCGGKYTLGEPDAPCTVCESTDKTPGLRRYCSCACATMAERSAKGKRNCTSCGTTVPVVAAPGLGLRRRRGFERGLCRSCADVSPCTRCGEPRKRQGRHLVCPACRRPRAVAEQHLRRARKRDAVCEHGPACVTPTVIAECRTGACLYCGAPAEHADHFEPLARGGKHCVENLVPACGSCNVRKHTADPWAWWAAQLAVTCG